jgi:hypothetical protein
MANEQVFRLRWMVIPLIALFSSCSLLLASCAVHKAETALTRAIPGATQVRWPRGTPTPAPYAGPTFAPLPTYTPAVDAACRLQWDQASRVMGRAWQQALADVKIEGLEYSEALVMGECTRPQTGGEMVFSPTQTRFYANFNGPGFDYDQIGGSFAQYLSVVLSNFSLYDLPGADGLIYGILSTSTADEAGPPIVWEGFFWLSFQEAITVIELGLSGRELLETLGIILPQG